MISISGEKVSITIHIFDSLFLFKVCFLPCIFPLHFCIFYEIIKKKNIFFNCRHFEITENRARLYDSHVLYGTWTSITILYFLSNFMIRIAVQIAFPCLWLILSLYRFKESVVNQMDIARFLCHKGMRETVRYSNIWSLWNITNMMLSKESLNFL